VALLRKETCNSRHTMHLRHPVAGYNTPQEFGFFDHLYLLCAHFRSPKSLHVTVFYRNWQIQVRSTLQTFRRYRHLEKQKLILALQCTLPDIERLSKNHSLFSSDSLFSSPQKSASMQPWRTTAASPQAQHESTIETNPLAGVNWLLSGCVSEQGSIGSVARYVYAYMFGYKYTRMYIYRYIYK